MIGSDKNGQRQPRPGGKQCHLEPMMTTTQQSPAYRPVILLVEDNAADLRLAQEVLKESRLEHQLLVARD